VAENQKETKALETAPEAKSAPKPPAVIMPTCPGCGMDPLILNRLRYDFADGVVVEVIFCKNAECRIAIGAQIVGMERPKR
jgi:hypothetical protein